MTVRRAPEPDPDFEAILRSIQEALALPDFPPDVPNGWADWYAYAALGEWR